MNEISILTKPRLLITVALPDPAEIDLSLLHAFQHVRVILLGVYEVREQTAPEQAEEQFGDEANDALEQVAERCQRSHIELEKRLVFTAQVWKTVERIVTEEGVDAVLYARPVDEVARILVPLHSKQQEPRRVASFVAALVRDSERQVQLRLLLEPEADAEAQQLLETQRDAFHAASIDPSQLGEEVVETDQPVARSIELAASCDLMVLGELDPSLRQKVFGEVHERIIPEVDCPVVLVLNRSDDA